MGLVTAVCLRIGIQTASNIEEQDTSEKTLYDLQTRLSAWSRQALASTYSKQQHRLDMKDARFFLFRYSSDPYLLATSHSEPVICIH